jgi:hypothetical protein
MAPLFLFGGRLWRAIHSFCFLAKASLFDAFGKTHKMAKQKFRPARLGGFSGAKAYIVYVEVLKKRRNAVGRTFCDAITLWFLP